MTTDELLVERAGNGVATVTINRPEKRNAMSRAVFIALRETFSDLRDDQSVRAVVITGAGDVFCAGADLTPTGDKEAALVAMRRINAAMLALHELPKPIVARVNGLAVGAGWSLALAADLVVASTEARFSQIFARRGLNLDCGSSWLLPRLIGMHKAKELVLLADTITAQEAADLGLVNRLVAPDELDATVADLAGRLASGPTVALSLSKRLLNQSFSMSMADALEAEAIAQGVNSGTEDAREGMRAFFEKREPEFRGR